MQELALALELRRATGSGPARRLRREGKVPATVYGLGTDATTAVVDYRALRGALSTDAGVNVVLNLQLAGERQLALVKDLQRHPLRGDVLHVDFLRVDPDAEVAVDVPITLVGRATAVMEMNGLVDQTLMTLHVQAKPHSIPNELELDVSDLEVGSTLLVGDIALPDGVESLVAENAPVVSGIITRSALVEATEEGLEEGEEPTDGDGEAAEAGEGSAGDDA